MVSKGLTIGLVGLLVLALVGGSAYILLRPDDGLAAESGAGYNRNDETAAGQRGFDRFQDSGSLGSGSNGNGAQGNGQNQGQPVTGGRGPGSAAGNGLEQRRQEGSVPDQPLADHLSQDWETIRGTVIALDGNTLTVDTDSSPVDVHLGPEWYWESAGIDISDGDTVEITGFYEGDEFEVAHVKNISGGEAVSLRDETGRPQWAGRGNGRSGGARQSEG